MTTEARRSILPDNPWQLASLTLLVLVVVVVADAVFGLGILDVLVSTLLRLIGAIGDVIAKVNPI